MSLTPQITLTAAFQDMTGAALGSAANPCKMRIDLCGFGQTVPVVGATSVIAQIEKEILSTNGSFSTELWGNDVITPAGTFYQITVIDGAGRVAQSGIYKFTGSQTIDLSSATQLVNVVLTPPPSTQIGYELAVAAATASFNLPSLPLPGTVVMLWYNGVFQGTANGRNFSLFGATVNLTFTAQAGDYIDVVYYPAS